MGRKFTKVIGDGITKRQKHFIADPSLEDWKSLVAAQNKHSADPWASMVRYVAAFQAALADLLEKRGPGASPSDFESRADLGWYYHRLIIDAKHIREHIDRGNAGAAAYEAAHWGETFSELQVKLVRERAWLTGQKQHDVLGDIRDKANQRRQADSLERRQAWQTEADAVWSRHPDWSKSAVALAVKKYLESDASHNTIRQALKKPAKAG